MSALEQLGWLCAAIAAGAILARDAVRWWRHARRQAEDALRAIESAPVDHEVHSLDELIAASRAERQRGQR